jgi:DNA polymerase-3 subunit gamma/tau
VHQLSLPSFNALLKSIEEPPPHVVFMMATTELEKIPETVISRSQVYELRTISTKAIAEQLRRIIDAETISAGDDVLQLIARDADGSMRDAQSKLDQVIAFTGKTITADDVSTVLGLVGRDLLLDTVQAVVDEDAAAAFALAARAVEMGYDLRLVCRELSRVVRDLLVLAVDPSRADDPEIAGENERSRLIALAGQFSREDLLRAFDLLTRAEADIRGAAQPRYHLEMVLLRWIYLRKLVPIEDLIAGSGGASSVAKSGAPVNPTGAKSIAPSSAATSSSSGRPSGSGAISPSARAVGVEPGARRPAEASSSPSLAPSNETITLKDAFLAEIRKTKVVFYNTVVAQAQKIDVTTDRITFTFSATQRTLRDVFDQNRAWLESTAEQVARRKVGVSAVQTEPAAAEPSSTAPSATAPPDPAAVKKASLREQAMADTGVQAFLEVFPAEIGDVEEM